MHDKAGFNDPYWLTKVALEKLGQRGQPLAKKNARLIDFGCGTGRLGVELKKVGYSNIAGVDGSSEMIVVANGKDCYNWTGSLLVGCEAIPDELLYKEEVKDSGFDAVFSSATMLPGHFPNTCYGEMLKVMRPGGHLLFSIRDDMLNNDTDEGCDFVGKLAEHQEAGELTLVSTIPYAKYRGLDLGPCMSETPASVKIYRKTVPEPAQEE